MPYCPKCGKPAPPKSAYCPICGTNIPHEDFLEPSAPELPPPTPPQVPPELPPVPFSDPFAEVSTEPPPIPEAEMAYPFPPEPIPEPAYPPPIAPSPPSYPPPPQPSVPIFAPPKPAPPPTQVPPPLDFPPAVPSSFPPEPIFSPPQQPVYPPQPAPTYTPPSAPTPTPAPPWQSYETTPAKPSTRSEEPYGTRHTYDDYDEIPRRSYGGVWAVVILILLGILAALYFGGVFNTAPPPNPQEEYKKIYESAATAVHTKNPAALFAILSSSSRNNLTAVLPKEKRLDSTLDDKADAASLVKVALDKGNFDMLFPAGDQPENMKELEGGRVSLATQQGKTFWLTKEGESWKLDIDPGVFGYETRRYLVLDAWDKICETIKAKNANDLYDLMDKASKEKMEEEAKLPALSIPKPGQPPKPRPKNGPPAFKNGKELLTKSLSEAKDLPDPTTLKIQKLEFKDDTARINLTNGNLIVLKEENSFWKLDLLYDGGPPTAMLGQIAMIATGKGAPPTVAPADAGEKTTEGASETGSSAGGKYVITGSASTTGDSSGGRSGPAIADKVNSNFNNRVRLGLITGSPSKAGTATANFTVGKDGSVYGVNVSSSNGDLAIEIKSACLSSRFSSSSGETKVTYHATVTGQ